MIGRLLHQPDYGIARHEQGAQVGALQEKNTVRAYRQRIDEQMKSYYVAPDYYQKRLKGCMGGRGSVFVTVAPGGAALLGIEFASVRDASVEHIEYDATA